jgi:uncharacterized protein (DUF488 family)
MAEPSLTIQPPPTRILTVGHSTRTLAQFVALLADTGVAILADVRKLRGSRAFPHFAEAPLRRALAKAGIRYEPIPELAGRRPKSKDPQPRPCWRNAGFRNYADHMRTPEFRRGVRRLLALARRERVAVMCAEAVPWRCHRSLVADWLVVEEKEPVDDVIGTARRPHRLTACARRVRGHLSYQLRFVSACSRAGLRPPTRRAGPRRASGNPGRRAR